MNQAPYPKIQQDFLAKTQSRIGIPGSGKTTYLLEQVRKYQAANKKVLFLTFSKAAKLNACTRLGLNPKKTDWILTIHSLAYRLLKIDRKQVMGPYDYRKICASLGLQMPTADRTLSVVNATDKLLAEEEQVRLRYGANYTLAGAEKLAHAIKEYKAREFKLDFIDMLDNALLFDLKAMFDYDVVIVDEAQDLSTKQWQIVEQVSFKADRVIIAGDDDQSIYEFNGADVDRFIDISNSCADVSVLNVSYRCPQIILDYGYGILSLSGINRIDKPEIVSKSIYDGDLVHLTSVESMANWSLPDDSFYLCLTNRLKGKSEDTESLQGVNFSTIHQFKGLEAQAIVLNLKDMSKKDLASVARSFFVGITRAKENLFIVHNKQSVYY